MIGRTGLLNWILVQNEQFLWGILTINGNQITRIIYSILGIPLGARAVFTKDGTIGFLRGFVLVLLAFIV